MIYAENGKDSSCGQTTFSEKVTFDIFVRSKVDSPPHHSEKKVEHAYSLVCPGSLHNNCVFLQATREVVGCNIGYSKLKLVELGPLSKSHSRALTFFCS